MSDSTYFDAAGAALRIADEEAAAPTRLFFYGTLMSNGSRRHALRDIAEPVGPASVRGDLYEVAGGSFPCMLSGPGVVHGEVWQVSPGMLREALRRTDGIEGYREHEPESWSMYIRRAVPLLSAPPTTDADGLVWTYFWNSGLRGLGDALSDGRWRRRDRIAVALPPEKW
jgi:gamma-glutamylcyclotransferase (GGCT)/AIG2-like uncharacterized protein YtfP